MSKRTLCKRIISYLLVLALCCSLLPSSVFAANSSGEQIVVELSGHIPSEIKDSNGNNIQISGSSIQVELGTYQYNCSSGESGSFVVDENTTEVLFAEVVWNNVWPELKTGVLTMEHQDGRQFSASGENENTKFIVPAYSGDSYYTWTFVPTDTSYRTQTGHIYIYGDEVFGSLNLSDGGRIPYTKEHIVTVKAPAGMEVMLTSQLKFYRARDYETFEPTQTNVDGYDYYEMHVPTDTLSYDQVLMLRQEGKVTRYGLAEEVGTWNEDKTVLTLRELTDDSYQVNRDQAYMDANVMTNLPTNSQIELTTGEYFDLVPLRAWQAIYGGNDYQDPTYHYYVIGDSVTVDVTEDDEIGQFGRITAVKPGVSLVLFSYEAMEYSSYESMYEDEYGLLCYSALWPELTGIAVVKVDQDKTGITTNIDMAEGRTVYFLRSQTSETGITEERDSYATYSFTPTSNTDSEISVRVHSPIMVENGALPIGFSSSTDWLNDGKWKEYPKNSDGSFTVHLDEGRNIIEIKSGEQTEYHVITARGVDVTLDNAYNRDNPFAVGDTVKVTLNGLLPALYKQSAIYNPSANPLVYDVNDTSITRQLGQYTVSTNANFTYVLTEEDVGTFTFSDGGLSTSYWGSSGQNHHRELTRSSMSSTWTGGDNPETNLGKLAVLPDITFDVIGNDDYEEVAAREKGLLKAWSVYAAKPATSSTSVTYGEELGSEEKPPIRNSVDTITGRNAKNQEIKVGADPLYDVDATILVRYWLGTDSSNAKVTQVNATEVYTELNEYNKTVYYLPLTKIVEKKSITEENAELHVELICVPQDGYPVTYSRVFYHNSAEKWTPALKSLEILSVPGYGTFDRFDGVLEAADITYTTDGNSVTQDLGYGFLMHETNYTTNVAYDVSAITFSAEDFGSNQEKYYATINGGETQYTEGETIPLQSGDNVLVVSVVGTDGSKYTSQNYTITIKRAASPDYVTFDVPAGAEVTVKKSGKTQEAYATNTNTGVFMYELPGGTYTYSVELEGYYTETGTFTAPTEEKIVVAQEDMESLPGYTGSFQVSIHGQQDEVCALTAMAIPEEVEDLQAKRYVTYNYAEGGYTVLHALLDACENAGVSFKCSKGVLTPSTTVDNTLTASGAGWVCEVNGTAVEPFSTLVKSGDVIRFYYNNNSTGMTHAWFDGDTLTATRGDSVTVTLMGSNVKNDGTGAVTAIANADILVDGKAVGTTDYTGKATIDTSKLLLGSPHIITASKADENGVNILTYAQATLTVNKDADFDPDNDPSTTNVTFWLIGDNKHSTSSHAYTTWIATATYTFAASSVSVADVFDLALECAGLEHDDFSDNYVAWINAPESLGGFKLSKKDNGSNSGWQYTVNGVHPSYGVNDFDVTSGDEIIFHYVDDYTTEESQFTWLAAEDVNPEGIDPVIPSEPVVPDQPSEPDDPTDPDDPEDPDDPVVPDSLNIPESIKEMYEKTAATLLSKTPTCGNGVSTLSDWMLFGLARSTFDIPDSYKETYLTAAKTYVNTMDTSGQLDADAPTENMRVALALTALGYDATNFEGKNLIQALENTSWVAGQGNNASAFALLAMDACDYVSTNTSVRQTYINSLIAGQNSEGGWAISGTDGTDQDTTMMVVTALAPYYETNSEVKTAVDKALSYIKTKQTGDGGFGTTAEGTAQVIVTLTALGIDPDSTEWNNSDGKAVIDALADYYTTTNGDGFMHDATLPKFNQMASEQSFYAMVAYIRYLNDQPALYDMGAADSWPEDSEEPDQSGAYTITVFAENGTVTAPASANADELIEVAVEADTGYVISEFNVLSAGTAEEVTVYESGDSYFFFMPENNVWLVATFEAAVVDDIAGAMADLTVSDADKETYLLTQQLQAAYDALTAEDYAAMTDEEREELASAYDDFKDEVDEFKEILEEVIDEALEELEDTYDRLDKDEYSSDNWKKIKEIRKQAKSDLKKAAYEEQVEETLEKALDDIEDVTEGGEMEVTFRLIGDFIHDNANDHEGYVTWIETTEYELEAGATVYDLFTMAIDDFDLNERGSSRNYVESIQAPDVLGGFWLGEFDNGRNSGWMYTVNGDHPGYGLQDWELEDGDEVVWHYVDDYTVEEYRGTWLEADDISPEEYIEDMLDEILTVGKHGEVDPDELDARDLGENVTFRFKPDDGYVVEDVIVDGKSMGSITSYTYKDLQISSRIEVEFEKKAEIDYRDVDEDDWFYEDVEFAVQEGLFEGTSEDRFSPNSSMTRAMLVTVLYRLEGEPNVYGYSAFSDIRNNQWYTDAVIWATRNGIVTGYDNGLFGTNDNVTREQMAAILYRYADYKGYDNYGSTNLYQYSDRNKISGYAVNAMKWANAEGLITGRTYSTLAPQGTATRAEVATILHRFVEYIVR